MPDDRNHNRNHDRPDDRRHQWATARGSARDEQRLRAETSRAGLPRRAFPSDPPMPMVAGERLDHLEFAMAGLVADGDGFEVGAHQLGPLAPPLRRALARVARQIDRIQRRDPRCACADSPISYEKWLTLVAAELADQVADAAACEETPNRRDAGRGSHVHTGSDSAGETRSPHHDS